MALLGSPPPPAAVGLDVSGGSNYVKAPKGVGVGGGGTIEDVTVRGGEVGLKIQSSQWALRGITLRGAASVGLLCNRNTNVQFVDIEVYSACRRRMKGAAALTSSGAGGRGRGRPAGL